MGQVSNSDPGNFASVESVVCQPEESSSNDSSEEAEQSEALPDQLKQFDDNMAGPSRPQVLTHAVVSRAISANEAAHQAKSEV